MTRIGKPLFVLLCCTLLACGASSQELTEKIDTVMAEFVLLDRFSGTVLVSRSGDILYARAFGEANKDHRVPNILETRFNIGSIGKTLTGVAVMQLAERDALDLDAPVVRYLPDFPYGERITIHHLLSHTSGLFNYMAHPEYGARMSSLRSVGDILPLIYDQELVFDTPGARFAYSNSGIVVLGAVIEKLSGQSYEDYLRQHILMPTGMHDTGINYWDEVVPNRAAGYTRHASGRLTSTVYQVPPASADGGIETTVLDLLKLDRALYGDTLLSAASRERMFTPNLDGYGYCWGIRNDDGLRWVGHSGGAPGVSASFRRYPDDRTTIIVLSNYSEAAIEPARTLEAIVFGRTYPLPKPSLGELLYGAMKDRGVEAAMTDIDAVLDREGYEIPSSGPLNMLGYDLLGEGKAEMAIAICELNVRRFPDEANPYDSLAEAHLASGDRDMAIVCYEKALKVDPGFANARQVLERLTADRE